MLRNISRIRQKQLFFTGEQCFRKRTYSNLPNKRPGCLLILQFLSLGSILGWGSFIWFFFGSVNPAGRLFGRAKGVICQIFKDKPCKTIMKAQVQRDEHYFEKLLVVQNLKQINTINNLDLILKFDVNF